MDENVKERLNQLFDFFRLIDREKFIGRQTYLTDATRKENDAEHAWHMAVMTILLAEYSNEKIDVLRTIEMLLIHDLVEIYAGDTYAYDEEGLKTKESRELAAADKLYGGLPEDLGKKLRGLWDEFEAANTPEAKFAHTMDNIQPIMLNDATDGKSWRERGVALHQIMKRNAHTADGSQTLWEYAYDTFIKKNVEEGNIREE
ncbi:MAG: HD domain-containing protein [Acetatifactor sp.]|nr:HD domain-containing protein [Acetatifactor sp.]